MELNDYLKIDKAEWTLFQTLSDRYEGGSIDCDEYKYLVKKLIALKMFEIDQGKIARGHADKVIAESEKVIEEQRLLILRLRDELREQSKKFD